MVNLVYDSYSQIIPLEYSFVKTKTRYEVNPHPMIGFVKVTPSTFVPYRHSQMNSLVEEKPTIICEELKKGDTLDPDKIKKSFKVRDPSVSGVVDTIIIPISFPVESYHSLRMLVLEK